MVTRAVLNTVKLLRRTIQKLRIATEAELKEGRDIPAISIYIDLMDFGKACRCLLPEEDVVFRGLIEENLGDLLSLYRGEHLHRYRVAVVAVVKDCIVNSQNDEPATPALLQALEVIPGSPWYPTNRLSRASETAKYEKSIDSLAVSLIADQGFPEFPNNKSRQADWFDHTKCLLLGVNQLTPRLAYSLLSHSILSNLPCSQLIQFRLKLHSHCRATFSSSTAAGYFIDDLLSDLELALQTGRGDEKWELEKQIDLYLDLLKVRDKGPIFEAMTSSVKAGGMAELGRFHFNSHKRAILHLFADQPGACAYYEAIDDWINDNGRFASSVFGG